MSTLTKNFTVTGMSCGHCENAIKSELNEIAGIESVAVSASEGTLSVQAADTVTAAAIIAAVDEAGYEATETAAAETETTETAATNTNTEAV